MGGKGGLGIPQGKKKSKREEGRYLKIGGMGGEGGHMGGKKVKGRRVDI